MQRSESPEVEVFVKWGVPEDMELRDRCFAEHLDVRMYLVGKRPEDTALAEYRGVNVFPAVFADGVRHEYKGVDEATAYIREVLE